MGSQNGWHKPEHLVTCQIYFQSCNTCNKRWGTRGCPQQRSWVPVHSRGLAVTAKSPQGFKVSSALAGSSHPTLSTTFWGALAACSVHHIRHCFTSLSSSSWNMCSVRHWQGSAARLPSCFPLHLPEKWEICVRPLKKTHHPALDRNQTFYRHKASTLHLYQCSCKSLKGFQLMVEMKVQQLGQLIHLLPCEHLIITPHFAACFPGIRGIITKQSFC